MSSADNNTRGVTPVQLSVRLLRPGARLPIRATPGATGLDLHACFDGPEDAMVIGPQPVLVPTGIAIEFPAGYDVQVRPRSGLTRQGLMVPLGTIDSDYRGEVFVTAYAVGSREKHTVRHGDRIAQLVITAAVQADIVHVTELSKSQRGSGGHGSTGV